MPASTAAVTRLRIATRASKLALLQAEEVASQLRARSPGLEVRFVTVTTHGDRHRDIPLAQLGSGDGVFTRGVEAELLSGNAELAVHSLKDLPTMLTPDLVLEAFPPRADGRDVLVSRSGLRFDDLPSSAVVGTSSPRRAAQIRALRADLRVVSVRGNVDSRLRKLRAAEIDALILAGAGLQRLGLLDEVTEFLPIERFVPAAGQGALAAQCHASDSAVRRIVAMIDDPATRAAVTAERVFLRAVGGGCRVPIGAHARVVGKRLRLWGFLASPDGARAQQASLQGSAVEAVELGQRLAEQMVMSADPAILTGAQVD